MGRTGKISRPQNNARRANHRAGLVEQRELLGERELRAAIDAMTTAILERNTRYESLVLVGIHTGGVHLARRIQRAFADKTKVTIPLGSIDITLYRDDVFVGLPRPEVGPTSLPCSLDLRVVILVDDVLFTGRTIRSALVELMDFGRPAAIQLAVLVDRGCRELPIQPDYVGLRIETSRDQSVAVMLSELGDPDRVALFGRTRS